MVLDVGTGDGLFVLRSAAADSSTLYVGLDANAPPLRKASQKIERRPEKGGLENALFLQASVEQLPEELYGLARRVHVNFPWGSLLAAVLGSAPSSLAQLSALCSPQGTLEVLLALDPIRDQGELERLAIPSLRADRFVPWLEQRYEDAGLRIIEYDDQRSAVLANIPTSWARRLRSSCRRVTRLRAVALGPGK